MIAPWNLGDRLYSGKEVEVALSLTRGARRALMKRPADPLPQAHVFIGARPRWLASEIWAWVARQKAGSKSIKAAAAAALEAIAPDAVEEPFSGDQLPSHFDIDQVRRLYEGGATLDALCRQFKVGKARLSRRLREAGAMLRSPGRRSQPGQPTASRGRTPWPFEAGAQHG